MKRCLKKLPFKSTSRCMCCGIRKTQRKLVSACSTTVLLTLWALWELWEHWKCNHKTTVVLEGGGEAANHKMAVMWTSTNHKISVGSKPCIQLWYRQLFPNGASLHMLRWCLLLQWYRGNTELTLSFGKEGYGNQETHWWMPWEWSSLVQNWSPQCDACGYSGAHWYLSWC